ncbi:MAG: hypothetical protein ABIA91_03745 [Patescibacteria group bacterium]
MSKTKTVISKPKIKDKDFYKTINDVVGEGRHVEYFDEVLKKYEEYKQEFEKVFTNENTEDAIYKFRFVYLLKKLVWRDIEILGSQDFLDIAEEIIESMGWENDHMHGFDLPEKNKKADPYFTGSSISFFAPYWEDDPHPTFKTDEIHICDFDYKKLPKLHFIFDFGDGHEFDVEFKGVRNIKKKEKDYDFPKIIDQRGVGPEQYPDYD